MFEPKILRFDSLPSTNVEASRQAVEGAPEGLCVVAAEQTAGRGRLERRWVSPKGAGLYFSLLLRPRLEQNSWPLITLMSAVAVHDTLLKACAVQADIKWPNDVLVNEKKLCGILAETVETPTGRALVVGIGINLNSNSFPPELDDATSVEDATGRKPDLEVVLPELVQSLAARYHALANNQSGVIDDWCARSSYANDRLVRIVNGDEVLEGTTRGIENDGALRIETSSGEIKVVRTGDVTSVRQVHQ